MTRFAGSLVASVISDAFRSCARLFVSVAPEVELLPPSRRTASSKPLTVASMVDQHAPHGLRRRGEEVASIVELLISHQPQKGLASQHRCAQAMAAGLVRHVCGRKLAQLVVYQRQ
jgi:hypothetical protein